MESKVEDSNMESKVEFLNKGDYFAKRLDPQIKWHDKKSGWNQRLHKIWRFLEIIAASSIPFLTSYITDATPVMKIAVGALSVLIAVASGAVVLFKFQEHWLQYRTTAESLKHHKYLFLTKTAPYDKEDSFSRLVETVEKLISKENSDWASYVKEKAKEQSEKQ